MPAKTVAVDLSSSLQTDANPLNIQTQFHEFVHNKQTFYKKMLSNQRKNFVPVTTNSSSVPVDKEHVLTINGQDLMWNDLKIATLGDVSCSNITRIGEAFSLSGYYTAGVHYTKVVNTSNVYTFFVDDTQISFPSGSIVTGQAYKNYLCAVYTVVNDTQKVVVYDALTQTFKTAWSDVSGASKKAFSPNETDTVYTNAITHGKALQFNLNDDMFFMPGTNYMILGKRYNYTNTVTIYTDGALASVDAVHSMRLKFTEDSTDQATNIYCPWGKLMNNNGCFYDYCPELVKSVQNIPIVYIGMKFDPTTDEYLINKLDWEPGFDVSPIQNLTWTVGFNLVTLSGVVVGLNCVADPTPMNNPTTGQPIPGTVTFPTNNRLRTDLLLATNVCDLLHLGEDATSLTFDANGKPANNFTYQSISSAEDGTKLYHGQFSGLTYIDAKVEPETKQQVSYDADWQIAAFNTNFKTADWAPNNPLYLLTYGDNAYNVLCYNGCMLTTPGLFDPELYPTIISAGSETIILYSDEGNTNWWTQTLSNTYKIDKVNIDIYKVNDSNGTVITISNDNPVVETNNQQSPFFLIRDMDDPSTSFGPASYTPSLIYANAGINIAFTGTDRCISFNDGTHIWPIYNPRCNADGTMSKAVSAAQVNTINKNGASYIVPFMLYNIVDRNISSDLFVTVTNGITYDYSTTPMYLRSFSQEGINITSFYKSRLSGTPLQPPLDANGNPIIYSQLPPGSDYYNNGTIETLGQFGDQRYVMRTVDNLAMMFTTEYSKVFANGIYFTLYGASYLYDGNNIMEVNVDADGLVNLGIIVSYCANLTFLGTNNLKAYFYRGYDKSIYSFSGGKDLVKEKEWSGAPAPTRVLWDSSANTLYWLTDDGHCFAYHNLIITEVGLYPNLYMTLDGLANINNGIELINRVVDGEIVYPFELTTGLLGTSSSDINKFARVDIRLYDADRKNVEVKVITTVVSTDTNHDKTSIFTINTKDYDRFGYCYLRVVPPNAEGIGLQIQIYSEQEINLDTLTLDMEGTQRKIQTAGKLSG